MFYKCKLGYNATEATKNICCVKGKSGDDQSTENRWLKKYCLGYKELDDQVRSGRPKTVDSGYVAL